MNNILISKMEAFIALNPEMVDAVLTEYGVSREVPLTAETVFSAFALFGEEFARDLFDAMQVDSAGGLKSLIPPDGSSPETQTTGGFNWESFFGFLTGAVNASPSIINAANGNAYPYASNPYASMPGYPSANTTSNTIIYVTIAVVFVVAMVVLFKKA